MKQDTLTRKDLQESAKLFAHAYRASRMHNKYAAQCLRRYGEHGPLISGIVRDHFPESCKGRLRCLARAVGRFSDAAWQAKPARVQRTTMFKLRTAIVDRDGRGFYG